MPAARTTIAWRTRCWTVHPLRCRALPQPHGTATMARISGRTRHRRRAFRLRTSLHRLPTPGPEPAIPPNRVMAAAVPVRPAASRSRCRPARCSSRLPSVRRSHGRHPPRRSPRTRQTVSTVRLDPSWPDSARRQGAARAAQSPALAFIRRVRPRPDRPNPGPTGWSRHIRASTPAGRGCRTVDRLPSRFPCPCLRFASAGGQAWP